MIKSDKKRIETELGNLVDCPSISVAVKDFFMEAGFSDDSTAQDKAVFYDGVAKFVSCIKIIAKEINENCAYLGSFVENEENYYKWKDIKKFDAYNALRENLKPKEIKMINISDDNLVDFAVECDLRYFSQIMFYFPESNIFIRPDVHCYLEIYGNPCILEKLYAFLKENSFDIYNVWYHKEK